MKIKFTWKVWLLIVALSLSLLSILGMPPAFFDSGVVIASIETNSTAFDSGLRQGQVITEINGQKITNIEDYSKELAGKFNLNESIKTIIKTKTSEAVLFSNLPPELTVSDIQKTNIKFGLDLAGGARALVKAQDFDLSSIQAKELADVIKNRLNVYGIEDIKVDAVSDLSGNNFIRIEIAGATPEDLENLVSQQGKFEAKIGNETVFVGGDKDITSVARSGQDAVVETCQTVEGGNYFCNFRFTIFLSPEAAQKHAEITKNLEANYTSNGETYLSEKLELFLDDHLVDSLLISEGLKGLVTTQISISGSGTGASQSQAYDEALKEMNGLQTILITGSLPYKLEIVKLDTLSPTLGEQFINSILFMALASFVAVFLVVFFRYRKLKISMALLITIISEITIILGIASFIKWNLDLPSIAGILATIGTGIDQQIIILDEAGEKALNIKQRMKRALSIILGAYFTALVAMIPLYWAAAGFFKGFAVTTIIGITAGILITRPAFTDMVRKSEENF